MQEELHHDITSDLDFSFKFSKWIIFVNVGKSCRGTTIL